jgi:hypothetical protein
MSLTEYLRWLRTPDRSRWKPMLMGLALSAAGAGAAVLLEASAFAAAGMTILAISAWVVGACAMMGYVRWYFASELAQARRDRAERGD